MKRFLSLFCVSILAFSVFAQGISEVQGNVEHMEPASTANPYDVSIDLASGTSSSDLVKSEFNSDGNLEVTYEGTENIAIGLSGTLEGTLIVKSDNSDYTLVLNNVDIRGNKLPAMQLKSTTTATLLLAEGSVNLIADSSKNSKKGALTGSGDIVIDGNGHLDLEVYKKHGIKNDGGLTIKNGEIFIYGSESAEGNMISTDMFFIMDGGNLTIEANGNVHASESKGIKVNGVEGTGTGLGYVQINGGTIDITSVGKAITAGWKIDEDATTADTSDDPVPNVYINGGNLVLRTTGTPYEYSDEESLSPEGIEAKDTLYINGGTIYAVTTDDTLNAGKAIVVNGGYVYARSTANDSIDSNGTIEINGGTVITMSSSREQAFDCDNDIYFSYTGGTFVGAGNGNNMPKGNGTTAHSIAYGNRTFYAGDQIAVLDSEGNVVTGFIVPYEVPTLTSIVFGSELFEEGKSYTIALGAFESQPSDGLVQPGAAFTAREEVVTMDMTGIAVSEGYIGMNIGAGMGMDFGGFDGRNFGGQDFGAFGNPGNMKGANMGFDMKSILGDVSLPEGIVLPQDLDSDTALQLAKYLLANYVDSSALMSLFQDTGMTNNRNNFGGQMPPSFN